MMRCDRRKIEIKAWTDNVARVARLVRALEMDDAELLIDLFGRYSSEIVGDLSRMEQAKARGDMEAISDLLGQYLSRAISGA